MAGERHSFTNNPVVIADEVKPNEVKLPKRSTGMDATILEQPEPQTMRVRHRRLGVQAARPVVATAKEWGELMRQASISPLCIDLHQ